MKITTATLHRYDLELKEPYTIAYEVVSGATNFVLELKTDTGLTGWGCGVPDLVVTGETPESVEIAFQTVIEPYLHGQNPFTYARILHELADQLKGHSSALDMVDLALHDLMAQKADVPLYEFLGGYRDRIETSITIGICSLEETLETAKRYHTEGFNILKIKGGLDVEADIERMFQLRERFPHAVLRFDGNQGYSVEESVRFCEVTMPVGIELFEQPTQVHHDEKLGRVTSRVEIPVMADESLKSLTDAFRLARNSRIEMINIKLMKVGGIQQALHINSVAKSDGIEAMVGCIDECALGIAAGLHFALSRPNIHYADLDGHLDFVEDPFSGLFELKEGWLIPSGKMGLGV